jgi:hypothetical protein
MIRLTAEIGVAKREVEQWQQQLADTTIRAPFGGVVTSKNAQPGEMISPMSVGGFTRTGICTIVDMSSLEIEVDVNESFINRVTPGQPVQATLDAYSDWKIQPRSSRSFLPLTGRSDGESASSLRPARPAHPAGHGSEGRLPSTGTRTGKSTAPLESRAKGCVQSDPRFVWVCGWRVDGARSPFETTAMNPHLPRA